MTFTAIITRDEEGYYVAKCMELPGCFTQGKTVEEAERSFADLLPNYLEVLSERRGGTYAHPTGESEVRRVRFVVAASPA
jgi:predicted RNase H-like HicB family nuclease